MSSIMAGYTPAVGRQTCHFAPMLTTRRTPGTSRARRILARALPLIVTLAACNSEPPNRPPLAEPDVASVSENRTVAIPVLANDVDPDGDALLVQSFTLPKLGTLVQQSSGAFTYAPYADANGSDSFSYTIVDTHGAEASADVQITITPVGIDLFVAPTGDDANAGTREAPFATLERARDALRALRATGPLPDGGAVVWLRNGLYLRQTGFVIEAQDSGTAAGPIKFRGYPGEQARLIGGISIPAAEFAVVTSSSPVWSRLDVAAQGQVLAVSLPALGITDYGTMLPRCDGGQPSTLEVAFNGQMLQLARWPDSGYSDPSANIDQGFTHIVSSPDNTHFLFDASRATRWVSASDVFAYGYWRVPWWDEHVPISNIDILAQTATVSVPPGYGFAPDQPFYFENLLEEITTPGEYYLDHTDGMFYFWPPADIASAEILVSTLTEPLFRLNNTEYVELHDLHVAMGRVELIRIDDGSHNVIAGCRVRNGGTYGIVITGEDNGVSHTEVSGMGAGGIILNGGDRFTLTAGRNYVEQSEIHDYGRVTRTYTPAVKFDGVGQIIRHNYIHDAPHNALLFSGNDHLIEYNDISHVCQWAGDAGAIYTGRDWGYRGNIIQYNFVHNIKSYFDSWHTLVHGIYLDDSVSGISVIGNVIYAVDGIGIISGGGRDNIIENNVIAKCGTATGTDRRGTVNINNISGDSWNLLEKIEIYNYTEPPWSTAYPALAEIPDDYSQLGPGGWENPGGCVFSRNLGWQNAIWMEEGTWGGSGGFSYYAEIMDNIQDEDPRFVDEAKLDLRLLPDSPAYTIPGFEPIPFESIGISASQ
jgi:hypothetical protein